ncbi:hypothetical protein HW532_18480 [Kaustia mangrovi]|uniref:Phage head morphogenesis domain-containing protein n=1 Tax=Kaustia mangrovi TaxID=2593653 RepID=A0A7S8C6Y2_9HYPH|nr:phage minor head protein [Kaustia mangrovi]QPC44507.1 hypothetical protein HW532_18480 [Kaustia mangrovi]
MRAESFRTPANVAPEVGEYFTSKNLRPAFSWLDVWGEEHGYAFTVAKAVEEDVLTSFRGSIERAIAKGQGFESWKAGIQTELSKLGWWGRRTVVDPETGERSVVDFSKPRRLKTIFWSNMRAARAAGQWERIQRTKAALPYLLYVRTTSLEPRQEHLQWAGIVRPVDDPIWDRLFTPNGWGCKCAIRQISRREAMRRGISDPITLETRPFRNRRTGEVTHVPVGIDPGWQTNPGKARARTLLRKTVETLEAAGPDRARDQIRDLWAGPLPAVVTKLPERVHMPVAVAPRLAGDLDARGSLVVVSNDTAVTKTAKHKFDLGRVGLIQEIIDRGRIVADVHQATARNLYLEIDGKLWFLAIGRSSTGHLFVRTLHPTSRRRMLKKLKQVGEEE